MAILDHLTKCPECGTLYNPTRVDERKKDNSFGPSDYVRCVECEAIWLQPMTDKPSDPQRVINISMQREHAEALIEYLDSALFMDHPDVEAGLDQLRLALLNDGNEQS